SGSSCSFFSSDLFLLDEGWNVRYYQTEICRNKGSTVYIWSSYDYPAKINGVRTTVEKSFWFIRTAAEPVDLKEDPKYKDRVTYSRNGKNCDLEISEVRESDSGVYKFRFITNHVTGRYTGEPGVTLTVGGKLSSVYQCLYQFNDLKTVTYRRWTSSTDRISCALRYYGMHRSPEVYPPQTASVSLIPPGQILEGSSVTLTCSSDANPAANFTWFKERNSKVLSVGPQFVFSSIQSTHSGEYYCKAENQLGLKRSDFILEVKYAPKSIYVSVNPPEILEGHSVTLTCSSDANPAANYTWFKDDQNHLTAANVYHLPSVNRNDSGIYVCKSENKHGWINSSVHVNVLCEF
uniref:B-cell receptor CD22 n=1 Tax=Oryzias latipes TaxID=8090 RepID=A0A3P9LD93_ORYLA